MLVKGLGSLLVLAVGTFLLGMAEFVIEGILPDLARDLNISIPMAGHAISIYALGVCVGATFLIVLHKLRPKHILLGLVSLVFIGALLSVTAQSYVWLLAARFISGLPHGAYYGVGTIVAYRLADESHKTRAVAIMCAGMTFANLLGNPVATLLSGALSWRLAFAVIAVGSLADLLLVARFVPNLDPLPGSGYKDSSAFCAISTRGSLSLPRCLATEAYWLGTVTYRRRWSTRADCRPRCCRSTWPWPAWAWS